MTRAFLLAFAMTAVIAGCKEKNPNFCAGEPDNLCPDASTIDAPEMCDDSNPCSTGVCHNNICVECVDNSQCTASAEPACDTMTNQCRGCRAHAECTDSNACLDTGTCAAASDVAYVSAAAGAGTTCTKGDPCKTLDLAVAAGRTFIKIAGGTAIEDSKVTIIENVTVTILADADAKLDRSNNGPIIEVRSANTNVTILDLQLTGATGATASDAAIVLTGNGGTPNLILERVAIHTNQGLGILAQTGGKLVMKRVVVSGNNNGGANIQNTEFEITNTLFVANGSATSTTGGLTISPPTNFIFEFNTIADNASTNATIATRGINCIIPMTGNNHIVTGHRFGTSCIFDYSLFDTGTPVGGTNNRVGEPMFKSTDPISPRAPTYYRIQGTSMAVDGANPAGASTSDIDGDMRPQGNGKDMGADEFKP